jgi:threonine dehydrogenase-like Zn-dependent dehydrogenase
MKNRKAILSRPGSIVFEDGEIPEPSPGEVLIEVKYVGICGSDVHAFESGPFIPPEDPATKIGLGHECSGVVVARGKGVAGFGIGDPVTIEPGVPCGRCRFCKDGRYNLCLKMDFMATSPSYRGALATYITHPEHMTYRIPEGMDGVQGALVEPAAVGMHAALNAGAGPGAKIVILGAGCIGLMTLQACRTLGANEIVVVDVLEKRLAMALKFGASGIVDASKSDTHDGVKSMLGALGADIVFETAGSRTTAGIAPSLVMRGGRIMIVGTIPGDTPVNFLKINREVSIQTVFRYANRFPVTIDAIASGRIDVKSMVSDMYDFRDAERAFRESVDRKSEIIKSVIRM